MASLLSFAKRVVAQVNPLDNGRTFKNPQGNAPQQQTHGQAPPSAFQQLTHSGASNFVGNNVVKPLAQFPIDASNQIYNHIVAPVVHTPNFTPIQVQPISGISKNVGATGSLHQTVGSGIQTALTLASGGLARGIEAGASRVLPTTILPRVVSNATIGAGFNASAAAGQGAKPEDILKAAGVGAALGGAVPLAGAGLKVAGQGAVKLADNRTPLNAIGAVGKNVGGTPKFTVAGPQPWMSAEEKAMASAPLTKQEIKAGGAYAPDHPLASPPSIGKNVGGTPEAKILSNLGASKQDIPKLLQKEQDQQVAIQNRQVKQPPPGLGPVSKDIKQQLTKGPQFKRTASENTQLNPTKLNIPEVNPGDYQQARINPQLASNPIDFATSQTVKAAQRLSKTEQQNIPHLVENPGLAKSPAAQEFVARHNQLTNLTHATSQALGGNTNFVPNYFRHSVDLSNPADAARWEALVAKRGGAAADPYAFGGVDNMNRVFKSVKDLQGAGFHLKNENNPIQNIIDYGKNSSATLKRQALVKGFTEADMQAGPKLNNFDLHNGNVIPLSDQGIKEIQGYTRPTKPNTAHAGYRAVNRKAKQTLLSASEFHPINISAMKAAPTLALEGHPGLAAKGLYGTFRAQVGRSYSDKIQQAALKDGTVEAAARLGTPIKFGSDYANEGKLNLGKAGFGEKTIFEKSMPAMHIRMVQGLVKDLKAQGIAQDSPEAHAAGTRVNEIMGFVNTEARNLNPGRQRALSDLALAPQFTRAKWATLKGAVTQKGVAGSYARRALVANAAADFTIIAGLGYAMKQKSDNVRDMVLRAILNPAVPTPLKDSKGNTINLKTPASYTSEALGLGITLERGKDGHLVPKFEPSKIAGNVANYGRNRLAILPSNALKVATNTNYAGKPLYDPSAPLGTKAEQGATTVASGLLPIGGQGVLQTKAVKSHLPGNVQDILNANQPGSNPLIKSIGSSFGLTPSTDKTVGKGLATAQYFDSRDKFTNSLSQNDKTIFNAVNPVKKNPVTGQPTYDPTVFTKPGTYNLLADNPNFTAKYQAYQQSQPSHDPLWDLPKDQLQKVLLARGGKTYPGQTYTKAGASLAQATGTDQQWYKDLVAKEQNFYNSIPGGKGSGNNIDYGPQASPYVSQQLTAKNYKDPQVQQYLNDRTDYTNSLRQQQGLTTIAPFGQVGVPGQLDNPAQLAITPKGSSYGTGAPKVKTAKTKSSGSGASRVASTKVGKASAKSFTIPKISAKKLTAPKGVKVKKVAMGSLKTRKVAVSKIPKLKLG